MAEPSLPREFARGVLTMRGRPGGAGTLPTTELTRPGVRIDRDHLTQYHRLVGLPVGDLVPALYPHLLGFPLQAQLMAAKDFPLPMLGMVHVRNEVTVHRAIHASEELSFAVSADGLRPHARGTQVDLLARATVGAETVWESRSTYLARGRSFGTPEPEAMPEPPNGAACACWRLPAGLGRSYAAVSGDINPIHLTAVTARAMGFKRQIAHGMWTAARTLAALGPTAGNPGRSVVWFRKPVELPSLVALRVDGDRAALTSAKDADRVHLVLQLG